MLRTPNTGRASIVSKKKSGNDTIISFVKDWSRIDGDTDDMLIAEMIGEVLDLAEEETNTLFSVQDCEAVYDSFASETKLPYGPVVEVDSVKRLDKDEEHEIEGWYLRGDYIYFDKVYGYEHPYYRQGLKVEFKAGFEEIPRGVELGLRQSFLTNYEDRQDNVQGQAGRIYTNSRKKFMKYWRP